MDGSQPITSPYLTGNFAPVRSEDDWDLKVTGEIPKGLAGAFYRNGPNPQFDPKDTYHWFGGVLGHVLRRLHKADAVVVFVVFVVVVVLCVVFFMNTLKWIVDAYQAVGQPSRARARMHEPDAAKKLLGRLSGGSLSVELLGKMIAAAKATGQTYLGDLMKSRSDD